MPNQPNSSSVKDGSNNFSPVETDTTLLLTATDPKPEELRQLLEKNKVLVINEASKTTVDSNPTHTTMNSAEQQTGDQQKRRVLPDHVREHFEESSRVFGNFVKKTEKNANEKVNEEAEADLWNKAIFFEEYPDGRKPVEIKNEAFVGTFSIPKKEKVIASSLFPTRITTDISKGKRQQTETSTPFHPIITVLKKDENITSNPKTNNLPFSIPKKTELTASKILPTQIATDVVEKNSAPKEAKNIVAEPVVFSVPKKPAEIVSNQMRLPRYEAKKKPDQNIDMVKSSNASDMGDFLKEKIIEGQLKNIFENAPEGTKATLEKMSAKMVFSQNNSAIDSNEIWKNKLRDYVIKIKWQGKTVLGSANATDPTENETVLEYIKRIYPAIVRAEVTENNKDQK